MPDFSNQLNENDEVPAGTGQGSDACEKAENMKTTIISDMSHGGFRDELDSSICKEKAFVSQTNSCGNSKGRSS